MGKKDEKIMAELTSEIRALLNNYDPAIVSTVLNREMMSGELKGTEGLPQVHVHVGGKKE
jgi:hypothetical protein